MRTADSRHECVELWLARDGIWRCELCEPPHWESEPLERKTLQELLRLFDDERFASAA